MQVGDRITGGDIYGIVHENSLLEHRIMLPPNARGTITYLAPHGQYNIDEEIIEVDFQGTKKVIAGIMQSWVCKRSSCGGGHSVKTLATCCQAI